LNWTVSEIFTDLDHSQIALKPSNNSIIIVVEGREVKEMMDNYLRVAREEIRMEIESGDI
jgi:hypothetical protein